MSTRSSKRVKVNKEELQTVIKDKSKETKVKVEEGKDDDDVEIGYNDPSISDYERVRLENIKKNEEFLNSLGLNNIKSSLIAIKSERPASRRGSDSGRSKIAMPTYPTRRSGRVTTEKLKLEIEEAEGDDKIQKELLLKEMLAKKAAGTYEAVIEQGNDGWGPKDRIEEEEIKLFPAANQPNDTDNLWVKPMIDVLSEIAEIKLEGSSSSSTAKKSKCQSIIKSESVKSSMAEYTKTLSRLKIDPEEVAKLTESRITQVWVHPSEQKLIVAAGDTTGIFLYNFYFVCIIIVVILYIHIYMYICMYYTDDFNYSKLQAISVFLM
jgi:hypothetical protein